MTGGGLFGDLPDQGVPARPLGRARLREPVRDQIELRVVDLDGVIGADHPVRVIWGYAEGLDLGVLEDRVKAREGVRGHPAIAPRLMLALWLYAAVEGIGSARAVERLCKSHDAWRWLAGGVSVNYHTLSDFRLVHEALVDRLLSEHVAALAASGAIDLAALTQDGIKVRASAGSASFRRRATLERHLEEARTRISALKRELHDDPAASSKRIAAARTRAAREIAQKSARALEALAEVEAVRKKREKTNAKETKKQKEPRASTSDGEARVMKMADGGFRPAYNIQVVSAAGTRIVVAVEPGNVGSDKGLMRPMLEMVRARTGLWPQRHLADGGFTAAADIEWMHRKGVAVYCPPVKSKHGTDPYSPRPGDGPGVAAWRSRMKDAAGQAVYKTRALCELVHARWRNAHLRLTVRGRAKVKAVMLWHALANNILEAHRMARTTA